MIRCIGSISGRPTSVSSWSRKLKQCSTSPYRSFRGKTHRDDPSGVLRPNIILDGGRSGREPPRLPELFQQAPRSFGLKRTAARSRGCGCAVKLCFLPVAEALSRTLSDAYRRVISAIRHQHVVAHPRVHELVRALLTALLPDWDQIDPRSHSINECRS